MDRSPYRSEYNDKSFLKKTEPTRQENLLLTSDYLMVDSAQIDKNENFRSPKFGEIENKLSEKNFKENESSLSKKQKINK